MIFFSFSLGITPFPYKIAKALDPSIYRNVEYDVWAEHRRELRKKKSCFDGATLKLGTKCLLQNFDGVYLICYIQAILDNATYKVYLEATGETLIVSSKELLPYRENSFILNKFKHTLWTNKFQEFVKYKNNFLKKSSNETQQVASKEINSLKINKTGHQMQESALDTENTTRSESQVSLESFHKPLNLAGQVLTLNRESSVNDPLQGIYFQDNQPIFYTSFEPNQWIYSQYSGQPFWTFQLDSHNLASQVSNVPFTVSMTSTIDDTYSFSLKSDGSDLPCK